MLFMKSFVRYSLGLATATALLFAAPAFAGTTDTKSPVISDPIEENPWEFYVGVPGWLANVHGGMGVRDVVAPVNIGIEDILNNLDFMALLNAEARKGRVGFYFDGLYLDASAGSTTPGPFFSTVDVSVQQTLLEGGIAYRIIDRERLMVDFLAGVRYWNLNTTLDLSPDSAGIANASSRIVEVGTETLLTRLQSRLSGQSDEIAAAVNAELAAQANALGNQLATALGSRVSTRVEDLRATVQTEVLPQLAVRIEDGKQELKGRAREAVIERLAERIGASPFEPGSPIVDPGLPSVPAPVKRRLKQQLEDAIQDRIPPGGLPIADIQERLTNAEEQYRAAVRSALAEIAQNRVVALQPTLAATAQARASQIQAELQSIASAKLSDLRNELSAKARRRLDAAEKKLEKELTRVIERLSDADLEDDRQWWDPYVGGRVFYQINDKFYLTAKSDIGGFGVGSDLSWLVFGGIGYHLRENITTEIGYKFLSVDYSDNGFVYRTETEGIFAGLKVHF